jgi:hypothetical protein
MATLRAASAELHPAANSINNANIYDAVGRKDDAAVTTVLNTKSILGYVKGLLTQLNLVKTQTDKMTDVKAQTDKITAIGLDVDIVETHCHSSDQWYGIYANVLDRFGSAGGFGLTPWAVVGGSSLWGTEIIITKGTVIGGAYFDLNKLKVIAVSTINRMTILQFLKCSSLATNDATIDVSENTIVKATHGLNNNQKLTLSSLVGSTGINIYTVYYVVNKTTNDFQLSLTIGGDAIDITGSDGTVNYDPITSTILTETAISRQSTTPDTTPTDLNCPRIASGSMISVRAAGNGGVNTVSFYIGLHEYAV